jgi:RNA polymerase sigma-70 factor (ECF subfamily)
MDESESELVAQAADGDRAAIQQLLTRHHGQLVAIIEDKVPADLQGVLAAEDVCQEAYVAVFQQIGSLQDRSAPAFRGWLHAIAERKLIDAIRALRAQKRGGGRQVGGEAADVSSVIELLDIVATHEQTPSRSAARRELISGVHSALERLNDDHREALRLHYIEGLSVAGAAERMGRSPKALVMLCNRALRQLAQIIGDPARFLSRKA